MRDNAQIPHIDVSGYRGQWIALDPETHVIVAHDRTSKGAAQMARIAGVARPLLFAVPESDAYFVGREG